MASPRVHILATAPLVVLEALSPNQSFLMKGLKIILILFAGVGIDIDHITSKGVKDFLAGYWRKAHISPGEILCYELFSSHVNLFHTWLAWVGFTALTYFLGTPLLVWAYLLHMFIDGANRWNQIEESSPLAKFFHRIIFCPLGWAYTDPPHWLGKSFEEWREKKTK